MFCKNCGAEIADDSIFCSKCGTKNEVVAEAAPAAEEVVEEVVEAVAETPVEEVKVEEAPVEVPKAEEAPAEAPAPATTEAKAEAPKTDAPKKSNVGMIVGIACGAAALFILMCVMFFNMLFGAKTLNLSKYTTVTFDGYETVGTAKVYIDWNEFATDNAKKLRMKKKMGGVYAIEYLKSCVSYELSQTDGLSNGDKVTLTWTVDDDKLKKNTKMKLKVKDKTYKVSDLEEIELFDPFEGINVEFLGTAPNGYVDIHKDSSDIYNYLRVSADKTSELSNGDKIKVTVEVSVSDSDFADKFGKYPSVLEKEFEVTSLPAYITKSSEIDDAAMEKMKKQCEDIIQSRTANWNEETQTYKGCEYVGNYFLTSKQSNDSNMIYMVYKVSATATNTYRGETNTEGVDYYVGVRFNSLMTIDGKTFVDTNSYNEYAGSVKVQIKSGGYTRTIYFNGYEDKDGIYKEAIVRNMERYNYEENFAE